VRFFEIEDAAGHAIGSFYLDAYARVNKRSGAWMDECIGRKHMKAGSTDPVAYLVCNFLPPSGGNPALLTHDDVLTLFHEFGHGLHHLLTRLSCRANSSRTTPGSPMSCSAYPVTSRPGPRCLRSCRNA
jgi:oligopeptidase A